MTKLAGQVFETAPVENAGSDVDLGARLTRFRERVGVTRTELARRMGVHRATIARIEARRDVKALVLRAYVEALGGRLRVDAIFANDQTSLASGSALPIDGDDDQYVLPLLPSPRILGQRDVIFSIKPRFAERIFDGSKTVELRRRFSARVPSGTIALIYTSSPTRALTGFAEITDVIVQKADAIWDAFGEQACISRKDFDRYFDGVENASAIKLAGARTFRRPVHLPELRDRFRFEPPQSFLYAKPYLRQALGHEFSELPY